MLTIQEVLKEKGPMNFFEFKETVEEYKKHQREEEVNLSSNIDISAI